jgi:uncharacterized damage-inducible protein DinB
VSVDEKLQGLQHTVNGLLDQIERLPAEVLYREPTPGEWPVMSTLAHLAELMPYWAHQAEQIARTPDAPFGRTHEDPDRLGAIAQHGHDSLDAMVPRIRAALAECIEAVRALPTDAWSKVGNSPTRGAMSVEQVVDRFICSHAIEHSTQVRETLQSLQTAQRP